MFYIYLKLFSMFACRLLPAGKVDFGCGKGKDYLDDQTSKKTKRELPEFGCRKDKGYLDDQTSKKIKRELPGFGCGKGKDYLDDQTRRKQKIFSR